MSLLSSTDLIAMGRHISTPFNLAIKDDRQEVEIKIDSILRVVPGKRVVALSHWQGRAVIVKLFLHSSRWKRTMLRDIAGINHLKKAKIPTPNLLLQATTADNKAGLLVIEYLQQGTSLATLFEEANSEERETEILDLAINSIALCHQAGLWQKDIHLDNFMLFSGKVYTLDGGDIKTKDAPLDAETSLRNFAMFVAQFPVSLDRHWRELVKQYRQQNSHLKDEDYADFPRKIIKARRQRLAAFERKLMRSTTMNRCERNAGIFYIYDRSIHSSDLEKFIADPDSFIQIDHLLKDGNSSKVTIVQIDKKNYVLKSYNIKGFWHGLSRCFRPGRAHHAWRNASVLEMLGVATAHPYLYLEERVLWFFRKRAYFLCELLPAKDFSTEWESQSESLGTTDEIIALFRDLFRVFFDYRISHGDMKASNFLVKDKQLYVLDLDAMVRNKSKRKFMEKFTKDMKRFQKNWLGTALEPKVEQLRQETEKF